MPANKKTDSFSEILDTLSPSQLPASGVAGGSYTLANVTVDAAGRVTAASSSVAGTNYAAPSVNNTGQYGFGTATLGAAAKITVNPNIVTDPAAAVQINAGADNVHALVLQRNSITQSWNIFECQDETGAALAYVSPTGQIASVTSDDQEVLAGITGTQNASVLQSDTASTGVSTALTTGTAAYTAVKFVATGNITARALGLRFKSSGTITNTNIQLSASIFSDNAGVPGTALRNSGGGAAYGYLTTAFAESLYYFSTTLSLTAGTTYWLVIRNGGAVTGGGSIFYDSANPTVTAQAATSADSGTTWATVDNLKIYFKIYGRSGPGLAGASNVGAGLTGTSTASPGIIASSVTGVGINATSVNSSGINATSTYGVGLVGSGVTGVSASGNGGFGVAATCTGANAVGVQGTALSTATGAVVGVSGTNSTANLGQAIKGQSIGAGGIYIVQTGSLTANSTQPCAYFQKAQTLGAFTSTGAVIKGEDTTASTGNLLELVKQGVTVVKATPSGVLVSAVANPVAAKTTAYTLVATDGTVTCSASGGAFAVTLPAANATQAGQKFIVKKTDSSANAVTLTAAGTDKIDGAATYALSAQYKYVHVQCDGASNWWVIGNN